MFYSTKSGRSNNQRRNIVFRKHLCLKMRKYTEKWDVLKENYPEELSFLKFDGSVNALLPVVEINGKSKIRHPVLENIEESSVVNNCYSASSNPISNEKLISSEFPSEKNTPSKEDESFIEHSDKTFIFTSETLSVIGQKDIEEVSKRLSVVEEKKEDNVPCPLYALSPEPMLSNNVEVSEISDNGNEDNKFKQFVDESIPGDPVACQYIEDEENIEISFESITHNSTNIHLEEETSLSVAVQPTLAKSPLPMMKVDHDECNDQDILNDLQVSSSDDESEEDYVRPRIINGFGDPFVIPHFLLRNGGINRDNLDSSMELNIKGVKNEFQHLECLSSNLSDESKLFKNEDKKEVSSKHESKNLEPIASKPSPENKDPIVLEMKTIERREEHSSLGNKTNTNINKNLPHMPQSINRIKNKGTHPKKRQKPLKPINHLQNSRNDSGKIKDKFNGFKNKNTSENKNTFNDKNIKRCKPIKLVKTDSTYEIKRNVTENALKNRNDKSTSSTSPLNISPKSDSYVRAHKDRNCVAKKDSIDTNLKKEKIIAQSNISLSKTIQKEKSYQPSSIRKRLTSEVENIIPIKRDLCKSLKTQTSMPAKNIHRPLKRTISLPEPSAKIANPVLDTIFKDMDAFPPPKTLIIKEPETQKYVAKAYWCSQSSNPIVPNPTIVRDPPLRDTGLHDQSNFTHADGRSINTHSSERPLDPKKILKRSSSLNSNILKKEEKNINPQFKPNEKIPYCINNMNKKSCRVERSSKYRKQTLSNALLVEKRVKIKTQKISASSTVENNKIKEPLPSMPSIVLTSSSSEQVKHNKSVTFDSLAPPLVEISTAASSLKSDELYKVSCKDKPSIKVSIPIFHYISLNRCHKGEFKEELSSNINKKQTFRDGKDNSHNNEIPNNMESKKSGTCAQIRISLNNQPKEKKVINTNLIPSKREQKMENIDGDTKNLTSLIPSKREQTIQNIVVDNSSPTGTSHVNLPVKTSKHSKATPKELINYSINGLKRLSTDLECERPRKQKKLPSRDYERMELHHSNELDSNIPSTPVCLGKDNVNTAVQFLTETSESNPEHTQSSELRSCNISQVTLTISKECEPLKTTIPNSLPPAERGFEILRDLAYSNDFQISVSKDHSDNRDVTCGKPSDTSCGRISQIESSTLRVKHPSLLQTIPAEDSRAQQLTGRRISVISPEALSSAAQSNEQESVKRHIWYREPENQSIPVKSNSSTEMPAQNPSVKSCETKSYFSSLLKENNNITELSNMFKKSLINGKKEYEQMHDVINCIEIDYNQNKVFIERVKKLPSRDIVELEIKRAEKVYEEKLVERELFIRQTIINLLDYFKGATDYLYLAVYVLLSQKVMSLSNDTTFKNSLFDLLKKWIRNDFNKHVFDQTESAFSDDCGIMQKLLGEIDDFSLFKTNVSISNATPINGREDQEVNFSFNGNNCEGNSTNSSNTPNINKHTVESMEFDFCSDNLLSEDLEPQPSTSASAQITTQTEQFFGPLEQFTNIEVTDRSSLSETSTVVESRVPATVSDVFDNTAQMQDEIMYSNFETQEFLGQPNLGVSMQRTEVNTNQNHNVCNNFVENEAILSFQKCQQEIFSQFDVSNNDISQCALNNDLESQIFMQSSVPQNCSILVNENTKNHYKKTQGLANVCHNTSIPLGQNLQSLRIPSGNNLNSNIHHSRQQIQNETHKTNCLQSKFDKYQNMRQEIKQSAIMNHVTNLYNSRENVLYSEGSNIPRQTLVGNEVLSPSCAQSTGSYNFGIQSGISQRSVTKPSVHHLYPQLQHVQPNEVQRHPNHFSNQNTEIEGAGQRCRTQSSNKEYDPSNHRSGQTFHPQSSFYPVQQPHQVVAQHFSEKNITEQFESGNHNIIKGNNTKNPGSREIENPYPAQHLLNDIPKSSQLYSRQVHKTIQPHLDPQQISFQSKARRRPSQELQRQLSYPLNQFRANTVTSQGNNSHIPRRLSNLEVQHDMSVYVMNHPRPNLNHVSSQMPQNKELDVTPQHIVHRRISNEEMTIQTMNSYQSFQSMETLSNQYPYGQNSNQPPDSRRSSIAIPDPSQQPNTLLIPPNSSSNQVHTASVFSEGNIHLSDMNQPQIREASRNISVDPNMVRINPGMDQNRSQSTEMTEDTEFVIPDEDLNKLMNVLDSGIIRDLIENNKNKSINKDQQDFNRKIAEINNASVLNQTSIINHDGTTKSALQNIDTNQKVIAKAPGDDLYFNGVNITKSQLLKFLAICRDQVVLAGLKEDRMTTFIGDYKTADGRSFTQVELTNLMTGAIAMNGLKITKCRRLNYEDSSNKMLINALKAEFLKDAASCTRISKILRNLAEHDNRDAQQAVQDLEDIGRAIHRKRNKTQREQVTLSEEVIVLDD